MDVAANGNFVVVWVSEGSKGNDSSGYSVQGQRYTSDGSPINGEFQVNTHTTSNQRYSAVAVENDGAFVVVWQSSGQDGSNASVNGQRFASDGSFLNGEFQINTYTTGSQGYPEVASDSDGDFIVIWQSKSPLDFDYGFRGQRFASNGNQLGDEFQVNSYTTGYTYQFSGKGVDIDPSGNFVVVWTSYGSTGNDPNSYSVQARRFGSDGGALEPQFQVNEFSTGDQAYATVSTGPEGEFVVTWEDYSGYDGSSSAAMGQRFASDGSVLGSNFVVNTYTTDRQSKPIVSHASNGDFLVTFTSEDQDGDTWGIFGQRFASDGNPSGEEFQVNTYTTNQQIHSVVAMQSNDDFVVVWYSGSNTVSQDGSRQSVHGQLFTTPIFADGFESGDTTAWSSTSF